MSEQKTTRFSIEDMVAWLDELIEKHKTGMWKVIPEISDMVYKLESIRDTLKAILETVE